MKKDNLSAYSDPLLDELVSGSPKIDNRFLQLLLSVDGNILELGCGYGRITIPLAKNRITNLTGLDLSAPSIEYAQKKANSLPIKWVTADVRQFQLDREYQFIFARGNVFDFMLSRADQEAMLARVHEHLADNGQFLFDFYYYPPHRMVDGPEETAWFEVSHPNGRKIYVSGKDKFDHVRQWHIQTCFERWDSPDGEFVREPWMLTLKYSMQQDVESLLHYNGFKVMERFVDFSCVPAEEDQIARAFLCQKVK